MKTFFLKIWHSKLYLSLAALALASVVGGVIWATREEPAPETFEAKIGSITETISVTGQAEPGRTVDLAFVQPGKVVAVPRKVGDAVVAGAVLARIDAGDVAGQVTQAEASLLAEQGRLEELLKGVRPEDLRVSEASVASARQALESAEAAYEDEVRDAYVKADDALRSYLDVFFAQANAGNPEFRLVFEGSSGVTSYNLPYTPIPSYGTQRLRVGESLAKWQDALDRGSADEAAEQAEDALREMQAFADSLGRGFSSLLVDDESYKTTIDSYKTKVSTARNQVSSALSALVAAEQSYVSARSALELAERQHELKKAGPTAEAVKLQEAAVMRARGALESARAQYSRTVIASPITGTVTRLDLKLGELASAGVVVATVEGRQGAYQVEAFVSEVDIGKVAVGKQATVTFDAFPDEEFAGTVAYVEPAETVLDGVVAYRTEIALVKNDPRFKSGLTANVDIETGRTDNVLVIPELAVRETAEGAFVEVLEGGEAVEREIKIGRRGSDGTVEVVEGLEPGDVVLNVGLRTDD